MNTKPLLNLSILILLILPTPIFSEELRILTINEPPHNFIGPDGELTGYTFDFVEEIKKRLGIKTKTELYPWARAFYLLKKEPNVVLFSVYRTFDREEKVHWISLTERNRWVLFKKKGSDLTINSLEDAKNVGSIGVMRGGAREEFLKALGFKNIHPVTDHLQNLEKLQIGRIDLMFYSSPGVQHSCRQLGYDYDQFEIAYMTKEYSDLYIAMSLGTPKKMVWDWQRVAKEIKAEGTMKKIADKWIKHMKTKDSLATHYENGVLNLWPKTE